MTIRLVVAFALLAVASYLPAASTSPLRIETSIEAMGGSFDIIAYGPDQNVLRAATEAAGDEIKRIETVMSNYIPTSEWSEINRGSASAPVRVSAETIEVLKACKRYHELSGGTFDITVGPLMKVWGFYKGTGRLPHRAEVRTALTRVGSDKILIEDDGVRFARTGMEIDPGGIGKGYAVDRAVDVLKQYGIRSALVSAARSSIYAMGTPPNNPEGWSVNIRDPKDSKKVAQKVLLRDQSMSTSGNYEKFFFANGKMYSHIMDPRTGYPAQGMLSVSVIAPRCMDSEAWTKPIYIQGRAWAEQHKPQGFRAFVCEDKSVGFRGPFGTQGETESCAWLR
ncbi:FAD:protein FMN transferase [Bryobacterales bacterium F-183]|nr:FAD:protein FMN transferase [Bryobacterales bacterium F-183]